MADAHFDHATPRMAIGSFSLYRGTAPTDNLIVDDQRPCGHCKSISTPVSFDLQLFSLVFDPCTQRPNRFSRPIFSVTIAADFESQNLLNFDVYI